MYYGSEFINNQLLRYCKEEKLTFTRGRAYKNNDGCFVEQKNYSVVRRAVGLRCTANALSPAIGRAEHQQSDSATPASTIRGLEPGPAQTRNHATTTAAAEESPHFAQ